MPKQKPVKSEEELIDTKQEELDPEETVVIKRSDLKDVLDAVEGMKTEISILRDASNRSRLEAADADHGKGGDERLRGHLKLFRNHVVHSWHDKKTSEIVAKNHLVLKGSDVVDEVINIHLKLMDKDENGEHKELVTSYLEFAQAIDRVYFRVVEATKDIWTIEFEDPELRQKYGRVSIPVIFVNP